MLDYSKISLDKTKKVYIGRFTENCYFVSGRGHRRPLRGRYPV